jgi:hypothetical protein
MLARKVSGTSVGMWLLVPELLRLGAWDIIKAWSGKSDIDIEPRIALQMVNESAMCVNRIRRKNSLNHQGFQLLNGMGSLVSDEQVHYLLNEHTMEEAQSMMLNLGIQRNLSGHYQGDIIAIDPHRIISTTKRFVPKKKKKPDAPSQKMLQTFFCVSAQTGQPIMATMSSAGMPTTKATLELTKSTEQIINKPSLLVADKEHFTKELFAEILQNKNFDLLVPAQQTQRTKEVISQLDYERISAGVALSETMFNFEGDENKYRFIAERLGEQDCSYTPFLTTSKKEAKMLLFDNYDKRWSVEEFFRFENDMGLNRASTQNLNIRYANLALAMIAQAATYQLRQNLNDNYKKWDAKHLANEVLAWNDGDIKVKNDTIIVTFYGSSKYLKKEHYVNLPKILAEQGINPKIPWLYDFKLDFRFK